MQQAPVFGNRFAQGDRTYEDFSFWWYWRQSDWSGGFKAETSSKDDAKYYYSTNIDTFSKVGSIQLAPLATGDGLTTVAATGEIQCGCYGELGTNLARFVGTSQEHVFWATASTWVDLNLTMTGVLNGISQIKTHKTKLFVSALAGQDPATGACVVLSTDGTSYTDCITGVSGIAAAMNWGTGLTGPASSRTISEIGNTLYMGVDNERTGFSKCGVVQTVDGGISWTKTLEYNGKHTILSSIGYNGDLYYLVRLNISTTSPLELRYYDISTSTDNSLYTFLSASVPSNFISAVGDKLLHVMGSKLIITIPPDEIWSYDTSNGELKKILAKDSAKNSSYEKYWGLSPLFGGGVFHDNKIFWGNLVYDGSNFYNYIKDNNNDTGWYCTPLFSGIKSGTQILHWITNGDDWLKLHSESGYKGTADKNWLVFNQIDTVPTIDKLFYSCDVIFNVLVSGQKIAIEYATTDNPNTTTDWVSLGSVSFSIDGAITNKIFCFPNNFIYKKIWIRVKLEGDGTTTPSLNDISVAFYPIPNYKQRWNLRLQCFDNTLLLDGKTRETKKGIELRNLLKSTWLNKQTVEFQDIDYAETSLSAQATGGATGISVYDTSAFPEQGIVKVEQEKIKYTAKTATQLSTCTRGFDGTVAATHASGTTINNAHQVIVYDYSEQCLTGAKPKIEEFIVTLGMMEI